MERREGEFFSSAVNRAARIIGAACGGHMLISPAVAELVGGRLPKGITLRDPGSVRMCDLSSPEWVYQIVHAGDCGRTSRRCAGSKRCRATRRDS